nr:retrovirus-related Pol polyprotein from transposon TNT 1-94 [Tanacetum cinerariifolium]
MVVSLLFTVNLYHDGLFQVNLLEYVYFDSRVIDDVSFDEHNGYFIIEMIHEDLHHKKPVSHVDSDSDGEINVSLDDVAHVVKQIEHENMGRFSLFVEDPDDEQNDHNKLLSFCGRNVSEGEAHPALLQSSLDLSMLELPSWSIQQRIPHQPSYQTYLDDLRVPRKNNMYSIDLKNIAPSKDLTCLFAKATLDESNLWHRRLGTLSLSFMRPFGDPVTILNTLDPLGSRPTWLFDIDTLIKSMNYKPVVAGNQSNGGTGFSWCWLQTNMGGGKKDAKDLGNEDSEVPSTKEPRINQEKDANDIVYGCADDLNMPNLEEIVYSDMMKKNKKDERGIVIRNKARLVAQGYTQEEGINYDEVFAPLARIKAIRLFLAYASFKDFVVYQMDVKSAFLYGKIEEE